MPYIDIQAVARDASQPVAFGRGAPDKTRILSQIRRRVANSVGPDSLPEDQRASGDVASVHALVQTLRGSPEIAIGQSQQMRIDEAGDFRFSANQRHGLQMKPIGAVPIVVIPVGDDFSAGVLTGDVAFFSN